MGNTDYVKCRLCSAVVSESDASEHLAAHGRVMEALARDESTECGEDE